MIRCLDIIVAFAGELQIDESSPVISQEISEILDPFFKIKEYLKPEAISGCTSYRRSILG
jgi:hypothetical protein